MQKNKVLAISVLVLMAILFFLNFFYSQSEKRETTFVTNVIDGDTIVVSGGKRVRLLGIDSDEKGEPFYAEAKARLEELIEQKEIELEKEGENKDRYDRLLRFVFLDNTNINLLLVEEGLARCYFYSNSKYQELCKAVEEKAIQQKIGIWQEVTD